MIKEAKKQQLIQDPEFFNLLVFHLSHKKKEKRLLKVFKTIEQLFESYLEVLHKHKNQAIKESGIEEVKRDDESSIDVLVSEEMNKEVREKFSTLLEDQSMFHFWLDLINILKYINDEGEAFIKQVHPHTEHLQPLLECFFLSFKILKDDDHISLLRLKSRRTKKDRRKKSVQIANLVDEIDIDEVENLDQTDFDDLKKKDLTFNELFTVMCELNKLYINHMIEKDTKLLSTSFSCILKVALRSPRKCRAA